MRDCLNLFDTASTGKLSKKIELRLTVEIISIIFDTLATTPPMPLMKTNLKKQRHKKKVAPGSSLVSAAVSIDHGLYLHALTAAQSTHEGNFSRYVRSLIRRDLGKASTAA